MRALVGAIINQSFSEYCALRSSLKPLTASVTLGPNKVETWIQFTQCWMAQCGYREVMRQGVMRSPETSILHTRYLCSAARLGPASSRDKIGGSTKCVSAVCRGCLMPLISLLPALRITAAVLQQTIIIIRTGTLAKCWIKIMYVYDNNNI